MLLAPFTLRLSPLYGQQTNGMPYLCEIGLQGGFGYYVGDATHHIFMNPREAYGIHFRYKFTKRWAIQAKVSGQRITGHDYTIRGEKLSTYTPYIFLGIGASAIGVGKSGLRAGAYIPLGIGFKWKFHEQVGLNIAWQHNIYMTDRLELRDELDNKHQLNGWNWMNCDLTGMFTVGIVFEFARAKNPCRVCNTY